MEKEIENIKADAKKKLGKTGEHVWIVRKFWQSHGMLPMAIEKIFKKKSEAVNYITEYLGCKPFDGNRKWALSEEEVEKEFYDYNYRTIDCYLPEEE